MRKVCQACDGRGSFMDHVSVYHNEREWQRVGCYACNGTGWRDHEEEAKQRARNILANAIQSSKNAKKALEAANKALKLAKANAKKAGVW